MAHNIYSYFRIVTAACAIVVGAIGGRKMREMKKKINKHEDRHTYVNT